MNRHKRKSDKLPRGLWVGRIIRPKRLWKDQATPEYFDKFYFRIRKKGLDTKQRAMPDYITKLKDACEYGRLQFQADELNATNELRASVNAALARRGRAITVGEYITALQKVAQRRKLKRCGRMVTSLRLVIAQGKGWLSHTTNQRMNRDGGRIMEDVDALTLREAVCKDVAHEFARIRQGGPRLNLDRNNPPEVNRTINSTLGQARNCFSQENRIFEVEELNAPWEIIEGFMKFTLPTTGHDVAADIPTTEAFNNMMEGCRTLSASTDPHDQELALVNEMLRLLGLRSGELVMARESWLHTGRDQRTYLWVKNYPAEGWSCKSTEQAKLPLTEALAARLRARCEAARASGMANPHLIYPTVPGQPVDLTTGATRETPERIEVVRCRHNAWLKGFIGEVKSKQGNHRLRKYCATRIYAEEMAEHHHEAKATARVKEYLRHSKEATSLLHYIAKNDERLQTVTDATLTPIAA